MITKKLNRCTECDKVLRSDNKSKLCSHHHMEKFQKGGYSKQYQRRKVIERRTLNCNRCGIKCSGKLLIEARKGFFYGFCSDCFDRVKKLNMREVREIISSKKLLLKS